MKVHITNTYGFNNQVESIKKQHYFAGIARKINFYEMGIFQYPVKSDSQGELSKRMDGIIASIETGDVVCVQLPTGNGLKFDSLFIQKLHAYKSKVVLLLHEIYEDQNWMNLYRQADCLVVFGRKEKSVLEYQGIENIYVQESLNEFSLKKLFFDLLDNVHFMFEYEKQPFEDEIHVGFGLHDQDGNYTLWVGVAIQSILNHTDSNVCFHVMHDSTLSLLNKRKLIQVGNTEQSRILFHFVDASHYDAYKKQAGHFSIGTLFRAELPSLIQEAKILYLDADILVNCDLKDLWNINIDNYCLAVVSDYGVSHKEATTKPVEKGEIDRQAYFNAGVLSMNLERIRAKSNLKEDMLSYIKNHPESIFLDQDALNMIYKNETLLLDPKWNYFVRAARNNKEGLKDVIYHYAGTTLCLYTMSEIDLLYFKTLLKTPWKNNTSISILKSNFARLKDRVDLFECILSKLTNKTKLIFYGDENDKMKRLYAFFNADPKKDYRVMKNRDFKGILNCKSLEVIKQESNFIVFVYPEADAGYSLQNLEQLGLKNEIDFFVVPRFMSVKDGGYIL